MHHFHYSFSKKGSIILRRMTTSTSYRTLNVGSGSSTRAKRRLYRKLRKHAHDPYYWILFKI